MKILTLWEPWASFIAVGWKTIETRTHDRFRNLKGETIGIHAGQHWDKDWYKLAGPYLTDLQKKEVEFFKENFNASNGYKGKIICTAKVDSVNWLHSSFCDKALIECETLRCGLFLVDIRKTTSPVLKGHQGIWNYDGEITYL
jgi:hypothetical protein